MTWNVDEAIMAMGREIVGARNRRELKDCFQKHLKLAFESGIHANQEAANTFKRGLLSNVTLIRDRVAP